MAPRGIGLVTATLLTLTGCSSPATQPAPEPVPAPAPAATTTTVATTPAPPPAAPQQRNWFDLQVGDCLTELPRIELGVVAVDVVDCDAPHAAEVFLRAPLEVNTAVVDVANQQCTNGFAGYTGRAVGGAFAVTYLIDSNQDRTSNNPYPSTVICLLQSSGGRTLTGSPRA